ncbi:MAG: cysteine desulfurase [Chitinophagales bacterium]|nr:cysteine desulfurase [Chitinophagales bacterium]MCZ2393470.1 cysteine desulfurase [Chitinophagales bacterium]
MRVYLDNAATTAIDSEVFDAMIPYFKEFYGNPSSQHSVGRDVKSAIEEARKKIAQLINAQAGDIVFTSGGTESNNTILKAAVRELGVKHIVISAVEHHCVLHTAEYLEQAGEIRLTVIPVDEKGKISIDQLDKVLSESNEKTLVSIMHANNETGVMIDIEQIAQVCLHHNALFHSDTVQTFAHYPIDVQSIPIDFLSAAAHKFHGPKGVGFFYMKKSSKVGSLIHGGSQERGWRAGTENVAGIIGMAKAAELAYEHLEAERFQIKNLKSYLIQEIEKAIPHIQFNGAIDDSTSYRVISLSLPPHPMGSLLLFQLDMQGICVSGGSACSSGANIGSHVMAAMNIPAERIPLRCSFSKYNTKSDIDILVEALKNLYSV